ncbi:phosphate signaling complex protein PhoU [Haloarcula amylovorans]|uniref:phosphate signaling complex protein PhoU n=1 Tax=Haloarcula amylovorans TaxID=2562280 RepID=UPI001075EB21|nr:phosphate signaling complex protein PhoU [Halomicroarcula amylolytica]
MTRDTFETELDALRADICAMGADVTDRLDRAVTAYERRDPAMGRAVAEADDEVNERYLALEQDCIDLIALQQPVASDLRFIAASFKILTDLERIADLASNLGEYVNEMESETIPNVPIADIADMALAQLDDAMTAYEERDTERCRTVAAADTDLDQRCAAATDDLVRSLINQTPDDELESLMADTQRFLLTVRDLERVGDHAVNIAARTLYMTESSDDLIY